MIKRRALKVIKKIKFKQLQSNHITEYLVIKLPETYMKITRQNTLRNLSTHVFSLPLSISHTHNESLPFVITYTI